MKPTGRRWLRFTFASLLAHGVLVGIMTWLLIHDAGHVRGSAGLSGSTRTRFDVTMETVDRSTPVKASAVTPQETPQEVTVPLPSETRSEQLSGNSETAPVGVTGQGGSGDEATDQIGDSDRTNRLGLYLEKMRKKIQENLEPAGYLKFPTRAKLILDLRSDGSVTKIEVATSSGDIVLDRLAIRAVKKSNPFDSWERDQRIEVPVVFR